MLGCVNLMKMILKDQGCWRRLSDFVERVALRIATVHSLVVGEFVQSCWPWRRFQLEGLSSGGCNSRRAEKRFQIIPGWGWKPILQRVVQHTEGQTKISCHDDILLGIHREAHVVCGDWQFIEHRSTSEFRGFAGSRGAFGTSEGLSLLSASGTWTEFSEPAVILGAAVEGML
jgi:hypothetical protein